MVRRLISWVLLLASLGVFPGAAAAALPGSGALKAQAMKLAAAGKHEQAAARMADARGALQRERTAATGRVVKPSVSPKYRAEVQKLGQRYRKLWEKGPRTPQRRKAIFDSFQREKAGIDRKYGMTPDPNRSAGTATAKSRVAAQFDLRDADLEELQAAYLEKVDKHAAAANLRLHALVTRTRALGVLGKKPEAEATAERLLRTNPRSPAAYQAVGELYQTHRKYSDAARAWEQGIRILGGSRELKPSQRSQVLSLFYRQLAFSYEKSGKAKESQQALARAQELERGGK
jgi:tetratricopeptide (TPR) repeat protein